MRQVSAGAADHAWGGRGYDSRAYTRLFAAGDVHLQGSPVLC